MNPFTETRHEDLTELVVSDVATPTPTSVQLTLARPDGSPYSKTHAGKLKWMSVFSGLVEEKLQLNVDYQGASGTVNVYTLTIGGLSPEKLSEETWRVLHGIVEEINKEVREVWDFMESREKLAEKFLIDKAE